MDAARPSEEQREIIPHEARPETVVRVIANPAIPTAAIAPKTESVSSLGRAEPTRHAKTAHTDRYAEKRLARKKKMRSAHRRRLKASHAKG